MSMLPLSSRRTPKTGSRGGAPHRRRFGFALLEALVALAIASIALATLYRSVGQGSKNVGDVEARVEATLLARSVLAGATYAEDLAQSASGQSGAWHWVVRTAPEQVQITEESGRSASSSHITSGEATMPRPSRRLTSSSGPRSDQVTLAASAEASSCRERSKALLAALRAST